MPPHMLFPFWHKNYVVATFASGPLRYTIGNEFCFEYQIFSFLFILNFSKFPRWRDLSFRKVEEKKLEKKKALKALLMFSKTEWWRSLFFEN